MISPNASDPRPAHLRQRPLLLVVVLMLAASLGPASLQIFLPALPAVQTGFGVSPGAAQLALSLPFVTMALANLTYGPFSDRHGRRPVLFAGLGLFLAGCAICAFAPSIPVLVVGRVAQAAGGAAGLVLCRAMVRDLFETEKAASMLAYVTMGMATATMIAPAAGGLVTDLVHWRATFALVGILGLVVLVLAALGLRETHTKPTPLAGYRGMLSAFARLLRSRAYRCYAFHSAFSMAIYFTFATGAPYVVVSVMGRPATEYGLYFVVVALGYIAGNFLAARVSEGVGLDRMVIMGSVLSLAGIGGMGALLAAGMWTPAALFLPGALVSFANGLAIANSQSGAVSVDPRVAGTASGLSSFLSLLTAAIASQAVGLLLGETPYPMVAIMGVASTLALGCAWAQRGAKAARPSGR